MKAKLVTFLILKYKFKSLKRNRLWILVSKKTLEALLLKIRNKIRILISPLLFNIMSEVSVNVMRQDNWKHENWEEKDKTIFICR